MVLIFYIMKYYIVELTNIEQNLNKLYLEKKEIIHKFLAEDCIIKESRGGFYKFKIQDNNCDVRVGNFIKDHTLVGTDFFEKKIGPIYHIPYEHHLINIERHIYSLRQNTKFIEPQSFRKRAASECPRRGSNVLKNYTKD